MQKNLFVRLSIANLQLICGWFSDVVAFTALAFLPRFYAIVTGSCLLVPFYFFVYASLSIDDLDHFHLHPFLFLLYLLMLFLLLTLLLCCFGISEGDFVVLIIMTNYNSNSSVNRLPLDIFNKSITITIFTNQIHKMKFEDNFLLYFDCSY